MRLVTVVFTALALSLGACMVEGPVAGEVKVNNLKRAEDWRMRVVLTKPDKTGYPDLYLLYGIETNSDGDKVAIMAVERDEVTNKFVPSKEHDCVDYFEDPALQTMPWNEHKRFAYVKGGWVWERRGRGVTLYKFKHTWFFGSYETRDVDKNSVKYTIQEGTDEMYVGDHMKDILSNGKNCDQVSESDNENGN